MKRFAVLIRDSLYDIALSFKEADIHKNVIPILGINSHVEDEISTFCRLLDIDLDNALIILTGKLINTNQGLAEVLVILSSGIEVDEKIFEQINIYQPDQTKDIPFL